MNKIRVKRFYLQETKSFPECPPQRESYNEDRAFDRACLLYAKEWQQTYHCAGCDDLSCPQCGPTDTKQI